MSNFRSSMPSRERRAAMLQHLIAGLPPKHQHALSTLERVNDCYVRSGRDRTIKEVFDEYLAFTAASQRYGRAGKGQAFYLTGESGAGKTDAAEYLLKTHPSMQPMQLEMGPVLPWVSVSLEGPATLANLGNAILRAAGYPIERTIRQSAVWPMLPTELAERGVSLVHIDETQHLLANKSEREALVKSLKGLMNAPEWPIRIMLTGMPETNEMLSTDAQGERRNFSVQLDSIAIDTDRQLVEKIIRGLCQAAGIQCDALIATDAPERIAHAASYQYGRVCEVTAAGIYSAALEEADTLTRAHLARAYVMHSHARGNVDMNPFLSDHWSSLKPGYFIIDREVYQG